jgi:hypothetical protein
VVEEVTDQCSISSKVVGVGWRLEDYDHPVVTDKHRSAAKDMRGTTTAMNVGRDDLGARREVGVGSHG